MENFEIAAYIALAVAIVAAGGIGVLVYLLRENVPTWAQLKKDYHNSEYLNQYFASVSATVKNTAAKLEGMPTEHSVKLLADNRPTNTQIREWVGTLTNERPTAAQVREWVEEKSNEHPTSTQVQRMIDDAPAKAPEGIEKFVDADEVSQLIAEAIPPTPGADTELAGKVRSVVMLLLEQMRESNRILVAPFRAPLEAELEQLREEHLPKVKSLRDAERHARSAALKAKSELLPDISKRELERKSDEAADTAELVTDEQWDERLDFKHNFKQQRVQTAADKKEALEAAQKTLNAASQELSSYLEDNNSEARMAQIEQELGQFDKLERSLDDAEKVLNPQPRSPEAETRRTPRKPKPNGLTLPRAKRRRKPSSEPDTGPSSRHKVESRRPTQRPSSIPGKTEVIAIPPSIPPVVGASNTAVTRAGVTEVSSVSPTRFADSGLPGGTSTRVEEQLVCPNPKCGASNRPRTHFCATCGAMFPSTPSAVDDFIASPDNGEVEELDDSVLMSEPPEQPLDGTWAGGHDAGGSVPPARDSGDFSLDALAANARSNPPPPPVDPDSIDLSNLEADVDVGSDD